MSSLESDNPLAPDALERIGDLQREAGALQAALSSYQEYERRFPNSSKWLAVLAKLGDAQRDLGNEAAAEQAYRTAAQAGPASAAGAQASLSLAELLLKRGGYDQARRLADSVLVSRSDESAARAQFILGEIAFAQRKFEDARLAYMRVKLIYSSFPDWVARAQIRIADCYREMGNRAAARDSYREVLNTHPSDSLGIRARLQLDLLGGR